MPEHAIVTPAAVLAPADLTPATSTDLAQASKEVSPSSPTAQKRDPHVLPTFSRSQSPILYLPPLLSSLPEGVVHPGYPLSAPAISSPGAPKPLSTTARLPTIDHASLSLHRALHHFRPLTDEYALVPYADAFNWDELELPEDDEREWYCVAFRSKRKEGSDGGREFPPPFPRTPNSPATNAHPSLPQRSTRPIKRPTKRLSRTEE